MSISRAKGLNINLLPTAILTRTVYSIQGTLRTAEHRLEMHSISSETSQYFYRQHTLYAPRVMIFPFTLCVRFNFEHLVP
jgi:hypothetical protein